MDIVRNDKLIKRNSTIGKVTSFAGIAILAAGLILSFNPTPTKTLLSFVALIVGFIVAQISTYFVSRFGRSPRFDELIADNLEKLPKGYTFYVYSTPVSMLLVGPSGLWIPIPISASGEISYDKKWRQKGGPFLLKLFGQENLGRPAADIATNEKEIRKFLEESLPENEMPPIQSILVSLNPNAKIGDVSNAPEPLVELPALRRSIRKVDRKSEDELTSAQIAKLNEAFGGK
jgi:hypothetical protein